MSTTISPKAMLAAAMLEILLTPSVLGAQTSDLGGQATPPTIILSGMLEWQAGARSTFRNLLIALPHVPAASSAAWQRVEVDAKANGFLPVSLVLGFIVLASLSGEWIVRRILHQVWREHQPARHNVIEVLPLGRLVGLPPSHIFSSTGQI